MFIFHSHNFSIKEHFKYLTLNPSQLEKVYLDKQVVQCSVCAFPNASYLESGGSWAGDCRDVSVSRSFHAVINRRGNVVGK